MIRLVFVCLSSCMLFACASGPQICECKDWAEHVGDELTIEAKVASAIWQHMIQGVPGKTEVYVDLDDKIQTVAYIEPAFNCQGRIRLTGKVIELRGGSKRGSKIDDKEYVEYHMDVTRWECLD